MRRVALKFGANTLSVTVRNNVVIVVGPRVHGEGQRRWRQVWSDDEPLSVSALELDTVVVDIVGEDAEVRADLLEELVAESRRNDRADIPAVELLDEAPTPAIELVVVPHADAVPVEVGRPISPPEVFELAFRAGELRESHRIGVGANASHPSLLPLLHHAFTSETEAQLRHARRDYVPTNDVLVAVRGRIDPASVVRHLRTGEPRLRCDFDEFTHRTPLLTVVATALEAVARGFGVSPDYASYGLSLDNRRAAVAARRTLGDVPSLHPMAGLRVGEGLRLTGATRRWDLCLRLAMEVLRIDPRVVASSGQPSAYYQFRQFSPRLWERFLLLGARAAALEGIVDGNVDASAATTPPGWTPIHPGVAELRPRRPDLLFLSGTSNLRLWCVDAKYKTPKDLLPNMSDRDQLFAYSHLVERSGRAPTRLGILYPTSTWPHDDVTVFSRNRPTPDHPVYLTVGRAPFPKPAHLKGDGAWASYVEALSGCLTQLVAGTDEVVGGLT